jgi:lysophospholipase L1-like esterase
MDTAGSLRDSLDYLRKETTASVVVVEANPGNSKIETWGPGSMDAIARCNAMMRRVAGESGAQWLDLESALGIPIGDAAPDGTHFTAEAHAALADGLVKLIQADRTTGFVR